MYGGFVWMFIAGLVILSPIIWFVWWMLADLGEPGGHRPHAV